MTNVRNDTDNTVTDTRFKHGNPGKPKGARSRVSRAIEALLEGQHEQLTQVAITKALAGDMVALRLCLERLAPARKDAPITIDLPAVECAADAVAASSTVLAALSAGEITPGEAAGVMALLTAHKGIVETGDLERRIAALEGTAS
ncbi:DUF5681 domain-containing protein [Sphingomonas antarctica]|uniref:DUF5681 domain-containing protein n=1 Tax=Sphingomonas antarctica TaxID=2040274 RepID=UPI0039ED36E2